MDGWICGDANGQPSHEAKDRRRSGRAGVRLYSVARAKTLSPYAAACFLGCSGNLHILIFAVAISVVASGSCGTDDGLTINIGLVLHWRAAAGIRHYYSWRGHLPDFPSSANGSVELPRDVLGRRVSLHLRWHLCVLLPSATADVIFIHPKRKAM